MLYTQSLILYELLNKKKTLVKFFFKSNYFIHYSHSLTFIFILLLSKNEVKRLLRCINLTKSWANFVRQWWRHFRDLFILFHYNTLWSHYIFLCCSSTHCLWFDRGDLKCSYEECRRSRESGQCPYSHCWWTVPNLSLLSLVKLVSSFQFL